MIRNFLHFLRLLQLSVNLFFYRRRRTEAKKEKTISSETKSESEEEDGSEKLPEEINIDNLVSPFYPNL